MEYKITVEKEIIGCAWCPFLTGSDECPLQDNDAKADCEDFDDLFNGCPLQKIEPQEPCEECGFWERMLEAKEVDYKRCPECGRKLEVTKWTRKS